MTRRIDWSYIKFPVGVLMTALTLSIFATGFSSWYEEQVMQDFEQTEKGYQEAMQRYEEADKNRALYERYLEDFLNYSKAGLIGEEQRLNWIEQLQKIDQEIAFPDMRYEISPREKVDLDAVYSNNKKIGIYQSDMRLSLNLLHEDDFIRFAQTLREQSAGFYYPAECTLIAKIPETGPVFNPKQGNLSAECLLKWLTVEVEKANHVR